MRGTAMPTLAVVLATVVALLGTAAPEARGKGAKKIRLEEARIFFEYNSSANDLGAQVFLDGESWKRSGSSARASTRSSRSRAKGA